MDAGITVFNCGLSWVYICTVLFVRSLKGDLFLGSIYVVLFLKGYVTGDKPFYTGAGG
jgi:hypothetical protein